ncbi:DUF4352 domain-containing protein [Micromonospora sp. DT233]|uniref:DUF4352 domain-containing protein n=1 Tax=Micromonospora sp. DT233 TaxID=3393432 RepID=UPI003CEEB360
MTTPYEPAQHQPSAGEQSMPPTAQFPPPPAGHYPPPVPGQFSVPPPSKKRTPWLMPTLIGAAAFVVLCCGGSMIISLTSDDTKTEVVADSGDAPAAKTGEPARKAAAPAASTAAPEPAKKTAAPTPTKSKTPRIGDKVRGGDFVFTVKGVKCGISRVGSEFLNKKAQGAFCRVGVTVKNVTKSAHTFHADGTLTAQDASGRKYDVDGAAAIYGNSDGQGFLDEINPGNTVTANVYFDVPKGTKLKTITFDAGLFTLAEDAVVTL